MNSTEATTSQSLVTHTSYKDRPHKSTGAPESGKNSSNLGDECLLHWPFIVLFLLFGLLLLTLIILIIRCTIMKRKRRAAKRSKKKTKTKKTKSKPNDEEKEWMIKKVKSGVKFTGKKHGIVQQQQHASYITVEATSDYKTSAFDGAKEENKRIEDNGTNNKKVPAADAYEELPEREELEGKAPQKHNNIYDTTPSFMKMPASLESEKPSEGGKRKVAVTCKDDGVYDVVG